LEKTLTINIRVYVTAVCIGPKMKYDIVDDMVTHVISGVTELVLHFIGT
jgi:hypothetical protein